LQLQSWQAPGGSEELAIEFGPANAPRLLVLPAWFDESNKLRYFTIEVMRALERSGVASVLPDLPGCNESLAPMAEQDIKGWHAAAACAAEQLRCTHVLAIRAGANIVPALPGFAYAPLAGKSALRAMLRARDQREGGGPRGEERGSSRTGQVLRPGSGRLPSWRWHDRSAGYCRTPRQPIASRNQAG